MAPETSIKRNFAYKSALTISSYIVAFITFPYVSRVLGVERIGLVNFVDNTIGYFLLFASMGVSLLGTREIASVKDSPEQRSKVFANIFGLNILFTILTLCAYVIIILTTPKFSQYTELFYIGTAKIIFTAFIVEWFYTGLENFRYITLRSLAIKIIYVVAVFLLVKRQDDYKIYFILTIGTVVLNAIVNTSYVTRYVKIQWRELFRFRYVRQNIILGIYSIMTSMYITFNVMYLGLASDNTQVGYYTTAYKIYMVILGLFASFTNVMMPRMSALLARGEQDQFAHLIDKSYRVMSTFCIPLIACAMILTPAIIHLLSGPGYEGAITPMRIIMPAALFVGIAQVLAIQVLAPMKKDKILFYASIIGATVSIIINIIVVPHLQSIGSAIVLLSSEIAVTTVYIVYVHHRRIVKLSVKSIVHSTLYAMPPAIVCLLCCRLIDNPILQLTVALPVSVIVWISSRYIISHRIL